MAEGDPEDRIWHKTFDKTFQDFQHKWELLSTDTKLSGKTWQRFQDKAKVKFLCSDCGRSWTSMKGGVIFWYRLDQETEKGSVRFKRFRQKCMNHAQEFQNPRWYQEEIKKVLLNVHQKIGEKYYGLEKKEQDERQRHGKPRKAHNSMMCEACDMGICSRTGR